MANRWVARKGPARNRFWAGPASALVVVVAVAPPELVQADWEPVVGGGAVVGNGFESGDASTWSAAVP